MRTGGNHFLEIGIASRTVPGQMESGDLHIVLETKEGALLAVVDGLGHGIEAATAARTAVEIISSHSEETPIHLVRRCHEELRETRGVVMSLASINSRDDTVTWLAVGNVEGILLRHDHHVSPPYEVILQRGGVVGYRLPPLQASVLSLMREDIIIMATDGIMSGFEREARSTSLSQELASNICNRYSKANDDALVLVAKYMGPSRD